MTKPNSTERSTRRGTSRRGTSRRLIVSRRPAVARIGLVILTAVTAPALLLAPGAAAQDGGGGADAEVGSFSSDEWSGKRLYDTACASCHGVDGAGMPRTAVGFEVPLPDFSDCAFASREPDADWAWVAHSGGPVRAFDRMMPAFGDALTMEEIQRVLDHVRTFCENDAWPRGELNLPRPMVTEKAYPEDEAVWTTTVAADGPGEVINEIVYERRIGARHMVEFVLPFGWRQRDVIPAPGSEVIGGTEWVGGPGDVAVGFKSAVFHSLRSGSILSLAGEVILPSGSEEKGLGKGTVVFEPFVAFGQILPANGFFQFQGGMEIPADLDKAEDELFWRATLGTSLAQPGGGRTWSPMVEVLGKRELAEGEPTLWDVVPQLQVTLPTRQHVMLNVGLQLPLNRTDERSTVLMVYLLWDWFDGGLFDGW